VRCMKRCAIPLVLLVLLIVCSNAFAYDRDTAHMRTFYTTLRDGTIVEYILGPIISRTRTARTALTFMKDAGSDSPNWLTTDPFISRPTDTIVVSRFVIFEDERILSSDVQQSHGLFIEREFTPHDSLFPMNGRITYLVQLVRADNDSVLWSNDTVAVYRTAAGFLRYRCNPKSLGLVKIRQKPEWRGLHVFLKAHVEYTNIARSAIKSQNGSNSRSNGIGAMSAISTRWEESGLIPKPKISSRLIKSGVESERDTILSIASNAITGNLNALINIGYSGFAEVNVTNMHGDIILHEFPPIHPGENKFELSLADIPKGTYYIRVHVIGATATKKFIVKH